MSSHATSVDTTLPSQDDGRAVHDVAQAVAGGVVAQTIAAVEANDLPVVRSLVRWVQVVEQAHRPVPPTRALAPVIDDLTSARLPVDHGGNYPNVTIIHADRPAPPTLSD